jgi:hypothetical protein
VPLGVTPRAGPGYRIADNQTATLSTWDDDKLPLELMELQAADFDLSLTGFSADELQALLAPSPAEGLCDPDDVPDPPAEPVTKSGDLWALGRHRLLCGDATKPEDLARLLPDGPADLLLTDPPYNVGYEGKTDDALTIANDAMDAAEYRRFLASTSGPAGRSTCGTPMSPPCPSASPAPMPDSGSARAWSGSSR